MTKVASRWKLCNNRSTGRSYLLGGVTVSYRQMIEWTGEALGIDARRRVVPLLVVSALGLVYDALSLVTRRAPDLTLEVARASVGRCDCDSSRAIAELYISLCVVVVVVVVVVLVVVANVDIC
jgi:hypothetical protein